MGYDSTFVGRFELDKELDAVMYGYLKKFNGTRRMKRNLPPEYGVEGEFFVSGKGVMGQDIDESVVDYNKPPRTQPSLWCQWMPSDDRMGIEWDNGEKFYESDSWIVYLINKILAPKGYVLNGTVSVIGEDEGDLWDIIVTDNVVNIVRK